MAKEEDQTDAKEENKTDPDRDYQEEKLKMSLSKALMTNKSRGWIMRYQILKTYN